MKYISSLSSVLFDRPYGRTLAILGSTGSIGTSALRVVAKNRDALRVVALAGARNMALLARQAETFRPEYLGVLTEEKPTNCGDSCRPDTARKSSSARTAIRPWPPCPKRI